MELYIYIFVHESLVHYCALLYTALYCTLLPFTVFSGLGSHTKQTLVKPDAALQTLMVFNKKNVFMPKQ